MRRAFPVDNWRGGENSSICGRTVDCLAAGE
ncbi:hypothetical protein JOF47_003465 [Paeniglutamicibacter kerguelensis]|uniref:Uncharacterized protein n=1 Tax=Paeniglutamicibacter kerguelensis TaxID=254788 RepID=A0ABS4XJT7_9MICC|nr:hypothetical protein [Paeniglutamicibacter kerguelensis]